LQDTRTPVKIAAICLGINVVLNFALMVPMKIGGIALASAVAATVNLWMLLKMIEKKIGEFRIELKKYLLKILTASLLTGLALYFLWPALPIRNEIGRFIILAPSACLLYFGLCVLLKVEHAGRLGKWLFKKCKM